MSIHKNLDTTNGIHIPHAYSYADATARGAASGFTSDDLYKLALQTDNNTLWILTAVTPTWVQVGLYSAAGTTGDILYYGTSAWATLAKGIKGKILQMNSGATAPEWGARAVSFKLGGNSYVDTKLQQTLVHEDMTLTKVLAKVDTVPVGSSIQIDVNKNGSTMLSRVLSIAAGASTANITSILASTPGSVTENDVVSIDVDQAGSTTAGGNDLLVTLMF
jgi:hypothetical protein